MKRMIKQNIETCKKGQVRNRPTSARHPSWWKLWASDTPPSLFSSCFNLSLSSLSSFSGSDSQHVLVLLGLVLATNLKLSTALTSHNAQPPIPSFMDHPTQMFTHYSWADQHQPTGQILPKFMGQPTLALMSSRTFVWITFPDRVLDSFWLAFRKVVCMFTGYCNML